jgi:hypothetical protein
VAGFTVVEALAELFAVLGSLSFAAMLALLVIDPSACGLTRIVAVADAPLARLPKLQVTVPLAWEQLPWLGVAESYVAVAGRLSVRVTPLAVEEPLFVAVTV